MIVYLPEIYSDELVYSWFCRYYTHSGHISHKTALLELYCKRSDTLNKEFIGNLNVQARECIDRMYSLEELVLRHTMFPQYARFLPLEQKKEALYKLLYKNSDVHHLFCVLPRREGEHYLRYCPLCAKEQGEKFWSRTHQIRDMRVCTKHQCRLEESHVSAQSQQAFTFLAAEFYIEAKEAVPCNNEAALRYAEYIKGVFEAPIDFEKDVSISAVLYHGMKKTKYLKSTGRSRYTKQLVGDMKEFYTKMGLENIASLAQVQRTLLGEHCEFSVVCQIAFFLGITVEELVSPKLTQEQIEEEQRSHYMRDSVPVDWEQLDEVKAPLLEQFAIAVYTGMASEMGRPERVSEKLVYRELGLLQHQLENMPKCRAIMAQYKESYPECWARRILWAYKQLVKEGRVRWVDIRVLAGVKKEKLSAIKPYLWKHGDKKTVREILEIAGDGEA